MYEESEESSLLILRFYLMGQLINAAAVRCKDTSDLVLFPLGAGGKHESLEPTPRH